MYDPPYAAWSIWQSCGWLERFVLILVGGLTIYSLLSAVVTVMRLRSLRATEPDMRLGFAKKSILDLQKHWVRIQYATHAVFYLFGLVLFLVLQSVGMIIGDVGPTSAANQVLRNFTLSCAFAANVLFGFLILHIVQWVISGRLATGLEALGA